MCADVEINKRVTRVECVTESETAHWMVNKGVWVVLHSLEASVSVACGDSL